MNNSRKDLEVWLQPGTVCPEELIMLYTRERG